MGNRRNVLDQFDIQSGRLKRGDGTLTTRPGALHAYLNIPHAELAGLLSRLLSGALTSKRSALATALESACTGTGPAERVAFGIGDGDRRVVERRVNVGNAIGHVTPYSFFLIGLCHGKALCASCLVLGRVSTAISMAAKLAKILDAFLAGDGLLGAFSRPRVCLGSLTANR